MMKRVNEAENEKKAEPVSNSSFNNSIKQLSIGFPWGISKAFPSKNPRISFLRIGWGKRQGAVGEKQ